MLQSAKLTLVFGAHCGPFFLMDMFCCFIDVDVKNEMLHLKRNYVCFKNCVFSLCVHICFCHWSQCFSSIGFCLLPPPAHASSAHTCSHLLTLMLSAADKLAHPVCLGLSCLAENSRCQSGCVFVLDAGSAVGVSGKGSAVYYHQTGGRADTQWFVIRRTSCVEDQWRQEDLGFKCSSRLTH